MKISKQSKRDAKQLFQACVVNGQLDEARVRQTVTLVIEKKPRGHVGTLAQFQRLVKLDFERRTARVESAVELNADTQTGVRSNLARKYGQNLILQFSVKPDLIGGLRIQVGSDVYDGSVKARLNNLSAGF
ncbi:MAG TPA: ATP synthase F1 subunit delta [Verrucomicrobiales bacterium]|nr:ATP synthase F1 subunit delta [Verrucomicrobiales bacterium]